MTANSFGARAHAAGGRDQLPDLPARRGGRRGDLPFSLKILLENLLRTEDGANVTADHVRRWPTGTRPPSRTPRSSSARPG